MPYKTKKVGSKTCVYKKDGGKKVGCTKGSGKKYLAALHANESKVNGQAVNEIDKILQEMEAPVEIPKTSDLNAGEYMTFLKEMYLEEGRQIADAAAEAFMAFKKFKQKNTEVTVEDEGFRKTSTLVLHGNPIAKNENGTISVTLAHWNTPTTRGRLNSIPGVRVNTVRGTPYLNGFPWDGEWVEV